MCSICRWIFILPLHIAHNHCWLPQWIDRRKMIKLTQPLPIRVIRLLLVELVFENLYKFRIIQITELKGEASGLALVCHFTASAMIIQQCPSASHHRITATDGTLPIKQVLSKYWRSGWHAIVSVRQWTNHPLTRESQRPRQYHSLGLHSPCYRIRTCNFRCVEYAGYRLLILSHKA